MSISNEEPFVHRLVREDGDGNAIVTLRWQWTLPWPELTGSQGFRTAALTGINRRAQDEWILAMRPDADD